MGSFPWFGGHFSFPRFILSAWSTHKWGQIIGCPLKWCAEEGEHQETRVG